MKTNQINLTRTTAWMKIPLTIRAILIGGIVNLI